eukprot:7172792-Alexandrium_andersonii.AAC.1
MAAIRRADLVRRHDRIGAPEPPGGAGRFWFPHRGGSTSDAATPRSKAVLPGALPTFVVRSCSNMQSGTGNDTTLCTF